MTNPLKIQYDFTKSDPYSWTGIENPSVGSGPIFTIDEDWMVATPY